MADDPKYGEITTSRKQIPAGEPVFILRARDVAAIQTLRAYMMACIELGAPREHVDEVQQVRHRFAMWRSANPTLMKVPD